LPSEGVFNLVKLTYKVSMPQQHVKTNKGKIREFFKKAMDLLYFDFGDIMALRIFKPKHMPEDSQRIQRKIDELSVSTPGQQWVALEGNVALMTAEVGTPTGATFNPARGLILKAFWNRQTGEIRVFPYTMFEQQ